MVATLAGVFAAALLYLAVKVHARQSDAADLIATASRH